MVFTRIDNFYVFRLNSHVFQTQPCKMNAFYLAAITAVNHDENWELIWTAFSAIVAILALLWAVLERIFRMRTDKKLDEIKQRGDAPFFRISEAIMGNIGFFKDGEAVFRFAGSDKSVLAFQHQKVEALNVGDPVILMIDDTGEPTHAIIVKLDGDPIIFGSAIDDNTTKSVLFFEYPYNPKKEGQEQRITISFETRSGVHNTHTYITRHGVRFLKRIIPPLPQ
jgi:hypothetical protein